MRICMICEGCYPFVSGGVSSWLHDLIRSTPQDEFLIWAIGTQESQQDHYAYELPDNVVAVQSIFLDSIRHTPQPVLTGRMRLTPEQRGALKEVLRCGRPDWPEVFRLMAEKQNTSLAFLSSKDFLEMLEENYTEQGLQLGFNDYFWTVRSMFLPLAFMMDGPAPAADLYHAVSAGYAGVLGAYAAQMWRKPFVLTEHGIYTREREEEIIRTDWVPQMFKDMWIAMFYMYTRCAYEAADCVTSLFGRARNIQVEIGCPPEKCRIIPNGIKLEVFEAIPEKLPNGRVDIGAVVRLAPIKDIKTMLYAFAHVCAQRQDVFLHIIGPTAEDEEYYAECQQLRDELGLANVMFTGRVNVIEYMRMLDFTLLTSISEGQPLAVLEGMAARRPAVTTDVGSCRELLEGPADAFGSAGICVPVMQQTAIAGAILTLAGNPALRRQMGEKGYKRVQASYRHGQMLERYMDAYREAREQAQRRWKKDHGGHRI